MRFFWGLPVWGNAFFVIFHFTLISLTYAETTVRTVRITHILEQNTCRASETVDFLLFKLSFLGESNKRKNVCQLCKNFTVFFRKSYATKNYQICYLTDDRQIPIFAWPLANFIRFRFLSLITKRHCELLDRARVCINNVSCFIDDLVSRLRRFLRLGIVAFKVGRLTLFNNSQFKSLHNSDSLGLNHAILLPTDRKLKN
jgi:hypothetical protein